MGRDARNITDGSNNICIGANSNDAANTNGNVAVEIFHYHLIQQIITLQ